jgi:hypothetical protein
MTTFEETVVGTQPRTTMPAKAQRSNFSKSGSDLWTAETIPKTSEGKSRNEVACVTMCSRQSFARAYTAVK